MLVGVLLLLIDAGTAFPEEASPASRPVPESLQGLSLEEVLQLANAWGMNSEENKAISFVTGREIHLQFPEGPNIVYPPPPDRMLVAIAPYIRKTHGCSTHYPSSCLGELPNTAVRPTVQLHP